MKLSITSKGRDNVLQRVRKLRTSAWSSKAMTEDVKSYKELMIKSVFEVYATRETRAHFRTLIKTKRATKLTKTAIITVAYDPHPLSHFQVKQTAITTGGRRKRVVSKRGRGYKQTFTTQKRQSTLVKVRKRGQFKLVHGRLGYMGFLQSGHDMIFERKQSKTWIGHSRAPIQRLYGLSFSQMAVSAYVQAKIQPWYDDYSKYDLELSKL